MCVPLEIKRGVGTKAGAAFCGSFGEGGNVDAAGVHELNRGLRFSL